MYKKKKKELTHVIKKKKQKQKTVPFVVDVIAKRYERHRFSTIGNPLSQLPRRHLCLPSTRIIHRYSESGRV